MQYPHPRFCAALPHEFAVWRSPVRVEGTDHEPVIVLECRHRIPSADLTLAREAVLNVRVGAKLRCPLCERVEARHQEAG